MSDYQKLQAVKQITGETDDDLLLTYLDLAAERVVRKCYPYRYDVTEVPDRYAQVQIEIAAFLWAKRGAEGETSHQENGINRTYHNADVPDELLAEVRPFVGVV